MVGTRSPPAPSQKFSFCPHYYSLSLGQFPMTEAYTPHSPCDFRSFKPPNFRGEVCGAQKPLVLKVFPQLNNLKSQNFPRFESLSATEQFEKSKQFEFAYYKPRKLLKLYTQILNSDPPPRNVFVDRRPPISSRMCGFPQVLLTQAHTPQVILTKRCGQNRPDTRRSNPIGNWLCSSAWRYRARWNILHADRHRRS